MIKNIIYKLIIFPIVFLFFGDFSSIMFCDDVDSTNIKENNEESSKNVVLALMFFISASILLYYLRNGLPISFSGNESLDMASKVTESTANVAASAPDIINSLQTEIKELSSENNYFRNVLRERDAEIAQLKHQNDILYQNNNMNEMHNRRYQSLIRNLRENDTKIDELTLQFYQNSGLRGKP